MAAPLRHRHCDITRHTRRSCRACEHGGTRGARLEHDLLHLLVRRLELADEHEHELLGEEPRWLRIHERDDVAHGLEVRREHLALEQLDVLPELRKHGVEGLDTVRRRGFGERRERERRDRLHLLVIIVQARRNGGHEVSEVRQHGAAEQDRHLLHRFDARVAGLPRLLARAHRLDELDDHRDAHRLGHDGEGASGAVAHVLVDVVDVGPDACKHGRQAGGLAEVTDHLAALHTAVVVLVDEQRLRHRQDLVHPRTDEVVELEEHSVHHLDQQVPLLQVLCRRSAGAHRHVAACPSQHGTCVSQPNGAVNTGSAPDLRGQGTS